MKIEFAASLPQDAEVVVLPVAKGQLDQTLVAFGGREVLKAAAAAAKFDGEAGATIESFVSVGEHINRIVLVGVGDGEDSDWEKAGGAVTARLLTNAKSIAIDLEHSAHSPEGAARFIGALAQRAWRIDTYRTKLPEKQKATLASATIVPLVDADKEHWAHQNAVTAGLDLTRTLVSEPPNIVYPASFVDRVTADVEGLGLEITVLGPKEMEKLGMGALLGVAQGSTREGRLLALKWSGKGKGDPDLALVGKGVTFDTGGISLKPGAGMEDMKWDMGGAGAVVGAMKALATRKAKANVIGVCGLVENMPDGNAIRPSDILTSMSGQTIEVLNTDAEGRLVLCDCVTWVQKTHRVKTIVDLATLTGAMIIALGNEHAGLFSNDDGLADQLLAAGKASGDLLWRFPISDAYNKLIDSPIADMKNVGPRGAGSITAAQFIGRFVEAGVKWAHLDIAGMVWADKPGATYDKGATGYGVRLLDRFVADNFEK
ncbi:MAG: leucyl aminopeptidase [Sphingomonas sp.]|uniref:leucyl aminopeptidase n=1 Tax=Sphingomonas sp. TaxID=28214 RepID=UPI0011FE16CD|nr:leucyl aminopeptidase [Sphingomonas sp.]THD36627.1 MAG: leucyl aminopeptidase [Sphingomonas sp.]